MGRLWRCLGCVGMLASSILTQPASATQEEDSEHRIVWVKKTTHILHHVKREAVCALPDWSPCPSSVGGGCCPSGYGCGTSLCSVTAAPTGCNGNPKKYSCDEEIGAGMCCPVGLICHLRGLCLAPSGVATTATCDVGYFACPSNEGGGCCISGRVCDKGQCRKTAPMTGTVYDSTTTTNSKGDTITITNTALTTYTETINPSDTITADIVVQVLESTVTKLGSLQTGSGGGSGGLSPAALGGIIAGVVVVGIIVIVAATWIVMRLRRAEKAAKSAEQAASSKHGSSNGQSRSHKPGFGAPSVSEIDSNTDVDPLQRIPIMVPSSHGRSRSATDATDISSSNTRLFNTPRTTSPGMWDALFDRQSSADSYYRRNNSVRVSHRASMDSQGHSRHPSDVSELEANERAGDGPAGDAQRRSSSITRPAKTHARRNSDLSGQNRSRGDSNAAGAGALRTVAEAQEIYGHYYGPEHTAASQIIHQGPPAGGGSAPRDQGT